MCFCWLYTWLSDWFCYREIWAIYFKHYNAIQPCRKSCICKPQLCDSFFLPGNRNGESGYINTQVIMESLSQSVVSLPKKNEEAFIYFHLLLRYFSLDVDFKKKFKKKRLEQYCECASFSTWAGFVWTCSRSIDFLCVQIRRRETAAAAAASELRASP